MSATDESAQLVDHFAKALVRDVHGFDRDDDFCRRIIEKNREYEATASRLIDALGLEQVGWWSKYELCDMDCELPHTTYEPVYRLRGGS